MFALVVLASVVCSGLAGPAVPAKILYEVDWKNNDDSAIKALHRSHGVLSSCPENWLYARELESCYLKIDNVNFEQAQEECHQYGAALASIHSEAENQLIYDLAKENGTRYSDHQAVLTGAVKVNGKWTWLDGTPFNFVAWAQGEPNNWQWPESQDDAKMPERFENCAAIYFSEGYMSENGPVVGRWNDNICDEPFTAAICKMAAPQTFDKSQ
ncbi:unnamed protein product, partial [Mesorhabditis spiculigera]